MAGLKREHVAKLLIFAVAVGGSAFLFVYYFVQLNIEGTSLGIDFVLPAIRDNFYYQGTNGLRNPPWSLIPLVPLAMLPDRVGWGLLAYCTIAVLIISVPTSTRRWLYGLSIALVVTAFPTLRVLVDAQLELLVIGGVLLSLYGLAQVNPYWLAAGVLIATAKPQAVFMLMIAIAFYVLRAWPFRKWLTMGLLVLSMVIPMMLWRGQAWLAALDGTYQAGSIIDIGLNAALNRAGLPPLLIGLLWAALFAGTLAVIWRSDHTLSREKAGFLIAASLLLAPYAAGNSVLIVLCIGIMIALVDSMYFFNAPAYAGIHAYYWTGFLLLACVLLGREIYLTEIKGAAQST
jgi:hypothetical protein